MKANSYRSSRLVGLVAAIEGLAVWIVAIFLASYTSTGSIVWPGADMYTTTVGTMHKWLTSPTIGFIELLGYVGLVMAVGGPLWFWFLRVRLKRAREWWDQVIWVGPGSDFLQDPDDSNSTDMRAGEPSPNTRRSSGYNSIEEALADGDFMRGGSRNTESEDSDSSSDWNFGAPK